MMYVYPYDIPDILEQSLKHNDALSAECYAKCAASLHITARLRLLEKWWEEAEDRIYILTNANAAWAHRWKTAEERNTRNAALEDAARVCCAANPKLLADGIIFARHIRALKEE
jgi:hypothetical protein